MAPLVATFKKPPPGDEKDGRSSEWMGAECIDSKTRLLRAGF
jgi:hypothetical protein